MSLPAVIDSVEITGMGLLFILSRPIGNVEDQQTDGCMIADFGVDQTGAFVDDQSASSAFLSVVDGQLSLEVFE